MSSDFHSCYGFGCSPGQMLSALLHSRQEFPAWLQFSHHDTVFTYQGRNAIALLCRLLNIGPGDEVLVPAYNCGSEVDPFVWSGAKVVFYRVDSSAAIDAEDIIRRVTTSSRIVYVTHYFGWPQDTTELSEWCKKTGLYLVEDCALALFSTGPNNTIGRIGDAAIYSFVKSLPVPDGGALALNRHIYNEHKNFGPPRYRNIFLNSLPLLKKWFMHEIGFWQYHQMTRNLLTKSWLKTSADKSLEIEREMPECNYLDTKKIDWTISRLSKGILSTISPSDIVRTRRRNYAYLNNAFADLPSLHLLFDGLPDGVCPLSFPVLVDNRNCWCQALEDKGVLVGGWPSYHRGLDWGDFPEARHLKNDIITLPVHQYLELHHMKHIVRCVKQLSKSL